MLSRYKTAKARKEMAKQKILWIVEEVQCRTAGTRS